MLRYLRCFMLILILFIDSNAFAATTNTVLSQPTIKQNGQDISLGTLRIVEQDFTSGSIKDGDLISIFLPAGVTFMNVPDLGINENFAEAPAMVSNVYNSIQDVSIVAASKNFITVKVIGGGPGTRGFIDFKFDGESAVRVNGATSNVVIALEAPGTGVTEGSYNVAKVVTMATAIQVKALNTETVAEDDNQLLGTVKLYGTFFDESCITLVLPVGYTWREVGKDTEKYTTISYVGVSKDREEEVTRNNQGNSVLKIYLRNDNDIPGFITVVPRVNVESYANVKEINVMVQSMHGNDQQVLVGNLMDYETTVQAAESKDITIGRIDERISPISIQEGLPNSIIGGRTITVSLPKGVHWFSIPRVYYENSIADLLIQPNSTSDSDKRQVEFISNDFDRDIAAKISLKNGSVYVESDVTPGPLIATISGSAGVSGEVTLGNLVQPITVEATALEVTLGAEVLLGDIIIKENRPGAILGYPSLIEEKGYHNLEYNLTTKLTKGEIVILLPKGVTLVDHPEVELVSGHLSLEKDIILENDRVIIPVEGVSSEATTLKIKNIKGRLINSLPQGDIVFKIGGSAIVQSDTKIPDIYQVTVGKLIGKVLETHDTIFPVGQNFYLYSNLAQDMDAVTYVKDGRTYVPVRYLCYGLGISPAGIETDGKSIIITKDTVSVTVEEGNNQLKVNGTDTPMDVAPEIINGRAYLPARFMAEAFGYEVHFDDVAKMVIVKDTNKLENITM
ncbi:copper amine oxidase N-terminal domain-containing protein [Desulfotomaculum sp. 1211_IL3151]|uniref:copper amine oxidase N-terminal domain-containing protein n=1 Tax=Desulfotomaculum sp. 1211_IL3151 TaxID=3084055 RepID=UPI002FDB56E0